MTFDNWIKDVKKKGGVDRDGAYGKQCVDLYNDYCDRVLGLTGQTGAACAKKILNNKYVMNNVKRINNTPSFVPQKGDICIWTSGTYGHVAICYGEGNVTKFKTIDQNWQPLTLTDTWHNYTYLAPLVFLRPKNQENIKSKVYKTTTDALNLRAKIGTSSRIILTIPKGKKVEILKDNAGTKNGYVWSNVKYAGKTGYVAKKYLK